MLDTTCCAAQLTFFENLDNSYFFASTYTEATSEERFTSTFHFTKCVVETHGFLIYLHQKQFVKNRFGDSTTKYPWFTSYGDSKTLLYIMNCWNRHKPPLVLLITTNTFETRFETKTTGRCNKHDKPIVRVTLNVKSLAMKLNEIFQEKVFRKRTNSAIVMVRVVFI